MRAHSVTESGESSRLRRCSCSSRTAFGTAVLEPDPQMHRARLADRGVTHDRHGTVKSAAVSGRFTMPITVAAADIDELGHVGNLTYVRWILDVATAHSRALGWDHARYREHGAVFVVRRHEVDYIAQVFGGEELVGETWVDAWRPASCIRRTELRRGGQVVARGATTWAFISLTSGRPQRITDELRELFRADPD
jgi:acyl-CoA thioester hydrolase